MGKVIQFPNKLNSEVQRKEQRLAEIEKENDFIKGDLEHLNLWLDNNIRELREILQDLAVHYGLEEVPDIDYFGDNNNTKDKE